MTRRDKRGHGIGGLSRRNEALVGFLAAAGLAALLTACRGADGQSTHADPELEARVEALLPKVAELSGLEVQHVPAVQRASRETLEKYLVDRLDAQYPGDSLESVELAYRAFGLLPDTVNLRQLLVDLLLEQTVGYYDPARDVLFIRDKVSSDAEDGVMVHELTHALQDQRFDLDSLMQSQPDNDAREAVQAAVEGQATVVMLAYMLEKVTGGSVSVDQLPDLGPEMAGALTNATTMPQLASAPAIVRETLLFSYLGGSRLVQKLWKAEPGRPAPLGRWLPESTEQVLHPERFLGARDEPTEVTITGQPDGWRRRYASDLGELETRIYFEQHLGDDAWADRAAAGWDGDAYLLLTRPEETGLVWYTVWDSKADASEFVDAYRSAFGARFGDYETVGGGSVLVAGRRRARVESITLDGRPVVRVAESPPGVPIDTFPLASLHEAETH